jgi:hypothetical protein
MNSSHKKSEFGKFSKRSVFRGFGEVKFYLLLFRIWCGARLCAPARHAILVSLALLEITGLPIVRHSVVDGKHRLKPGAGEFCLTGLNMASLAPLPRPKTAYRYGL